MRVHHLNCVTSCPLGGKFMDGESSGLRGALVCHCLLVEGDRELVLVDTGFGLLDVANPRVRLSKAMLALLRPELRADMTAYRQIKALGFDPRDVRQIVLTHLDFDHAGGLDDFPEAKVHLLALERDSAAEQKTMLDRMRYRPQQWSSRERWVVYPEGGGEPWFGFDCVRGLEGVPAEILLVPLIGHTLGHAGVAVRRDGDWLLMAGDAYFFREEMNLDRPRCTPGLDLYQRMMEKDRERRLGNQARLRQLIREHGSDVSVVSAHDVVEFARVAGHPHDRPFGGAARVEEGRPAVRRRRVSITPHGVRAPGT
jgi:glyoxylase-like metal-dependent hydrolase (beta-lactamase superfamily II)